MTPYLFVPLLFALAVLQASAVPYLAVWGVFPDLPLLVVVLWGLLRGTRQGIIWGFVGGLALDVLSGIPFGAGALSLAVVGYLSGLGESTVFRARTLFPAVMVFAATLLYDLILLLMIRLSGQSVAWLDSMLRVILPSAGLNAALAPVATWGMRRLVGWLDRRRMEF